MATTYIPHKYYKGVVCRAFGMVGVRYSAAIMTKELYTCNTAFHTIKAAKEHFDKSDDIIKMVLYIYHPKTNEFEIKKYFEK